MISRASPINKSILSLITKLASFLNFSTTSTLNDLAKQFFFKFYKNYFISSISLNDSQYSALNDLIDLSYNSNREIKNKNFLDHLNSLRNNSQQFLSLFNLINSINQIRSENFGLLTSHIHFNIRDTEIVQAFLIGKLQSKNACVEPVDYQMPKNKLEYRHSTYQAIRNYSNDSSSSFLILLFFLISRSGLNACG